VGPRYESQQYYQGYWSGGGRQFEYNHRWDKDKRNRDYDRGKGNRGKVNR